MGGAGWRLHTRNPGDLLSRTKAPLLDASGFRGRLVHSNGNLTSMPIYTHTPLYLLFLCNCSCLKLLAVGV